MSTDLKSKSPLTAPMTNHDIAYRLHAKAIRFRRIGPTLFNMHGAASKANADSSVIKKHQAADSADSQSLDRKLTERQLAMLALGGAIGVGLFLGTSITVQLAGPGVILSYLLGAVIAMIVAYAIA